ncbi:MAG: hypothetical protein K5773_05295 [Pseudobutyrivibrio sp.]|nr:hypothetical protein [Pseudobutyrivibrio sp.]
MRKSDKDKCIKLLDVIGRAHDEILADITAGKIDAAVTLLESLQQAAISMGNIIESSEGEGLEIVSKLEEYCEFVFVLHENLLDGQETNVKGLEKKFKKIHGNIDGLLSAIPEKNVFVFLPYKAAMWDALESIWEAANADNNCDAFVVPIPYYDKNPDGSLAAEHYEINDFPAYVPVVDYRNFDLAKVNPDVVFIINPYDEYNFVTTVHPEFYSYKLKNICKLLIYVPYYSLYTFSNGPKLMTSADRYVDYIVIQSKEYMHTYHIAYTPERMIPMGSPKFDRVIKMENHRQEVPTEWKKIAASRKVIFFNSSVQEMINGPDKFLNKMEYVFDTFKKNNEACLLWRPHPLMEGTFKSMEPENYHRYLDIKNKFIGEKIGIYDDTPDIEVAIAFSDAYIGTSNSSVPSLFFATGKEIFITNINIKSEPDDNAYAGKYFYVNTAFERYNKYQLMDGRHLFEYIQDKGIMKYLWSLPGRQYGYGQPISYRDKIVLPPIWNRDLLIIDKGSMEAKSISFNKDMEDFLPAFVWSYQEGDYLYLVPNGYPDFIRINLDTQEVASLDNVRDYVVSMHSTVGGESKRDIGGRVFYNGYILLWANPMKEILKINAKTLEHEIIKVDINRDILSLSPVGWGRDRLYTLPRQGTVIYAIDYKTGKILDSYDLMIEGLESVKRNPGDDSDNYFSSFAEVDKNTIVASPLWANKFVKLDLKTGQAAEWKCQIPLITTDVSPYISNISMGYFITDEKDEKEKRYYHLPSRTNYSIDMGTGGATEIPYSFPKESIEACEMGFAARQNMPYCAVENEINSLSDFINGNLKGRQHSKEKQLEEFKKINAATDGSAGKNIYEFLKNKL